MKSQATVHFGPVWGRPVGQSMALCMADKDPGKEPRTMTRTATVTCPDCIKLLPTPYAAMSTKAVKGGAA